MIICEIVEPGILKDALHRVLIVQSIAESNDHDHNFWTEIN